MTCAVVIPIYKLPLPMREMQVLKRNLLILVDWPIIFILPIRLKKEWDCNPLFKSPSRVIYFKDRCFSGIESYNDLLLDIRFYLHFRSFTNILICQLDVIVVRDELRQWCAEGYSYIGAPWLAGYAMPTMPYKFLGVGNGGFSLRRVAHFIRLLAVPRIIRTRGGTPALIQPTKWIVFFKKLRGSTVQEDVFWSLMKDNYRWFTTPAPETALKFAFEVAPRHLFELNGRQMPFGGHAWEKYDKDFWLEHLPDLSAAAEMPESG